MSQVWPPTDSFDHGSPAYGTALIGYLGLEPNTSDWGPVRLSSGYGAGKASFVKGRSAASGGVVRRQAFAEDVQVQAVVKIQAVAGTATAAQFNAAGVAARIQGGTLAGDGSSAVRFQDVDGYAFLVTKLTDTTLRFRLVRWDAGVETVLATVDGSAASAGHFVQDVTLLLQVEQDGSGDVSLVGSITQLSLSNPVGAIVYQPGARGDPQVTGTANPSGPAPSVGTVIPASPSPGGSGFGTAPGVVPVISVTDSSVDKITGGGRCGFLMDTDRTASSVDVVGLCSSFQVAEKSAGAYATSWRDEWARAALSLAESLTDAHGTVGRNLGCDYTTDQASSQATAVLERSTSEEAVEVGDQIDLGNAVELEGDKLQYLLLNAPEEIYPTPAAASATQITIVQWLRIDSNRDGNEFMDAMQPSVSGDEQGFRWGWRDAGGGNSLIEVTLGGKDTPQVFQTDPFPANDYLGETWCFVMTYRANADVGSGKGRIRIYVGRLGGATLLNEIDVPADTRPQWHIGFRHLIGTNVDGTVSADRDFDGAVDSFHVFYGELTSEQVNAVCDQYTDPVSFTGWGMVQSVDFEVLADNSPLASQYGPWFPAGVAQVNWWIEVGASGLPLLIDGLIPASIDPLVAWHQRPADDPVTHGASIDVKPGSDFSLAGVVVRGGPTSDASVYDGYRMDVAPGTPASIRLYRMVAGTETFIARQSSSGSPISVTSGVYTTLELLAQQQADALPTGAVQISAEVGGTPVAWTLVGADGVALDADDNVVDLSDARLLSGPAVGFHTIVDTTATLLDDWAHQGVLATPADAYPSLSVPAEDANALGDLDDVLTPEWAMEVMHIAPRRTQELESGHQQRLSMSTYEAREFRFSATLKPAEWSAFEAFWLAHEGPVKGFAWNPGTYFPLLEAAGVFAFREGTMQTRRVGQVNYSVSFEIEERRLS